MERMCRRQYDMDSPATVFAKILFLFVFSLGRIVKSRSRTFPEPGEDSIKNEEPASKP